MQTDHFRQCRVPASVLIAVDLEPTDAGVRRINSSVDEFAAPHRNGSVDVFPSSKGEKDKNGYQLNARPVADLLSA